MDQKIFIRPPQIGQTLPSTSGPKVKPPIPGTTGPSFESIFKEKLEGEAEIKFSAHALKRLESRQINLNSKDLELLKDAVNRAEAKGARESLILMDQLALVVSVKNRTVITAVDGNSLKDNVFTNIDSAVIVKQ
ncbi:MAG TPA: TIGR02530 family flagellar biosynthesis protein [Bacillota bacterium]|nr:TIGR02530 family flagellar biosynthesis protein [Bacillota bacterium]